MIVGGSLQSRVLAALVAAGLAACTADASRFVGGTRAAVGGSHKDAASLDAAPDEGTDPPAEAGDDAAEEPDADDDGSLVDAGSLDDGGDGDADIDDSADAGADATDAAEEEAGPVDAAPEVASHPITIDDSVTGTGLNQFNYVGVHWQHCVSCQIGQTYYNMSNSWNNFFNEYLSFTFIGTHIDFYGVHDPGHGIGAASIDGGPEKTIDFYGAQTFGNQLMYSNDAPYGMHVFKLRVTGMHNPLSSDVFVVPDRIDVR
jgi:hypothetical protein